MNYRALSNRARLRGCILAACVGLIPAHSYTASTPRVVQPLELAPPISVRDTARLIVEAPRVGTVAISPDGTKVVYSVWRYSYSENRVDRALWLTPVGADGVASDPVRLPGYGLPKWCPDGACVTYFESSASSVVGNATGQLVRYNIADRHVTPIRVEDTEYAASGVAVQGEARRAKITTIGAHYKWSPSGRWIAFTAPLSARQDGPPLVGIAVTMAMLRQLRLGFYPPAPNKGLFVVDLKTGCLEQVSPRELDIRDFDWSADERGFAVEVTGDRSLPPNGSPQSDVYLIDRAQKAARPLVVEPGVDESPIWSPDGKWIAFRSAFGAQGLPVLAVVPSSGGVPVRLTGPEDPRVSSAMGWFRDSQALYFASSYALGLTTFKIDLRTRQLSPMLGQELNPSDHGASLSADQRTVAFVRHSVTAPADVMVQTLPDGPARAITRFGGEVPAASRVRLDRVEWPSRDGKYRIHGLLFTPRDAWRKDGAGERVSAPLPTVVYIHGGPSMVSATFPVGGLAGDPLVFALRGYAVLVPNTRGRPGFGEAFLREVLNGLGRMPYEDVMSGVDALIQKDISDPSRLGIYGHSYGGYLTSYAMTQTGRFRAAVVYEGGLQALITMTMQIVSGPFIPMRLNSGTDPFERGAMAKIIEESPAFNLDCVRTPEMLIYGARSSHADQEGRVLYTGLQRFKIPSEFILYDQDHAFDRPKADVDRVERMVAWFDYWVRGLPYPDSEKQREYDAWQQRYLYSNGRPEPSARCPVREGESY